MLKKIKRAFGFGSCDPMEGSTIIINAEKLERRVALSGKRRIGRIHH